MYCISFGILDLAWRWLHLRYSTNETTKCWTPSNDLHVHNTRTKCQWLESLRIVTLRGMIENFQFYPPRIVTTPEFAREMEHIREFTQGNCVKHSYVRKEEATVWKWRKGEQFTQGYSNKNAVLVPFRWAALRFSTMRVNMLATDQWPVIDVRIFFQFLNVPDLVFSP